VHAPDGESIVLGLKDGADFGFEFVYDSVDDDLELWFKKFYGNDAARMTWKKNGNVGIGITTLSESLDVIGNVEVSGNVFARCIL